MKQEDLLNKFSTDLSHPHAVRSLALVIFDETNKKIREMPERYREYLDAAALLHDIGYHIDSKGHNKHSMKMIVEHGIDGFSHTEAKIIGCICRYHRGSLPDKEEHEIYSTLDKKERKIVKYLGGILRIADGLDKGHFNLIKNISINYNEEHKIAEFILTPKSPDFTPDISDAIRKRDLFEIAFKCQCVLRFA